MSQHQSPSPCMEFDFDQNSVVAHDASTARNLSNYGQIRCLAPLFFVACSMQGNEESSETSKTVITSETSPTDPVVTDPVVTGSAPEQCNTSDQLVYKEDDFPQKLAHVVCDWFDRCGCPDPKCIQGYIDYFLDIRTYATDHSLAYDANCLAARLGELSNAGCSRTQFFSVFNEKCASCYVYTGDALFSESCVLPPPMFQGNFLNVCADQGGICKDSVCKALSTAGEICYGTIDCDENLACDGDKKCASAVAGEPCLLANGFESGCARGFWCENFICRDKRPINAECYDNGQCETARCAEGKCVDYNFACELTTPQPFSYF